MLHARCVQLGKWYKRPASGVALHVEASMHELLGLHIIDVAVLDKRSSRGGLCWRMTFVIFL